MCHFDQDLYGINLGSSLFLNSKLTISFEEFRHHTQMLLVIYLGESKLLCLLLVSLYLHEFRADIQCFIAEYMMLKSIVFIYVIRATTCDVVVIWSKYELRMEYRFV